MAEMCGLCHIVWPAAGSISRAKLEGRSKSMYDNTSISQKDEKVMTRQALE